MFCACDELLAKDPDPEGIRIDDADIFPPEACLDSSKGVVLFPEMVGIPMRSEKGCPNASQSFSTRAYKIIKEIISSKNVGISKVTIYPGYT